MQIRRNHEGGFRVCAGESVPEAPIWPQKRAEDVLAGLQSSLKLKILSCIHGMVHGAWCMLHVTNSQVVNLIE